MLKQAVENVLGRPNTATHGYQVSGTAKFLQLDADAIRKELGIDESAVLRGRENLPKTDSDAPDDTERAVIKKIDAFRQAACNDYDGEMRAYEMRLGGLNVQARSTEIIEAARKAEGDFEALVHHAVLELTKLRDERDRAKNDLQAFREQNRLSREASLPKWHPVLSWSLLVFILVIETVLNGLFFGERVEGGLIQGVGEAFIFALINVGCGFAGGRIVVPRLLHVQSWTRVLGGIALASLAIIVLGNNLLAAHYRAVLVDDVDILHAAAQAWRNMLDAPFTVGDGKSVQLMVFGLLASLAAGWKAWNMDEPYPGYGDKTRLYMTKLEDFIEAKRRQLARPIHDGGLLLHTK